MNIKVLTVLTLLTAVLQVVWAPPVATFIDCVTATPAVPAFYYMALGPTFDTDIVAKCSQSCLQSGYQYAGISEGTYCFCSALFDPAAAVSAPLCDFLCDGLACGTEDSNVFAAYDTGGGSPAFTMVATNDPVTVQVDLTPEALGASFLVDLDVEAPPSYLTLASISTPGFLVPGLYTVKVLAMIEGTKLSSYDETNLTQEAIPVIDEVACPIVWEPNELYYCNVSVTMQNELDSYTSTFSDDLSAFSITGIGSEIYRLGTPPPRGISLEVAAPYSDIDEIRKAVPISRASQLLALDFYAYAAGDITAGIIRPTCAGGVYSVDVGGCMTLPPDDPDGLVHTCEATGTFWPQEPTCGDGAGVGMVEEAPATWAFVPDASVTMTFVEPGFYRELLAAPVDLLPGDTISATGPVGKSPVERQWGDVVDGVPTTSHHYVAAVVKEKMPIQLAHICTTINVDVTLDVVDDDATAAALANHTSCERNITDIALVISQIETDLFNTTVNYAEPYYIRSNTDADFIFVFSVAGPTTFTLAYDPPIGLNNTFVDLTDYPLGLAPHNKTEVLQMADDFVYIITVYAANQHNDLTGPVSNTAILYVQHPVLPTWTVAPNHPVGFMIPSQLGEIIFINSDTLANFPTNASAYVEWGDGITQTLPFEHSGDKQPILKHNYTNHGIYNISVYIYNVVSGYNVSCQILIVEEIINFEVYVKYFPSETSTTPRDGFGKYKNQYPLDKNLTFFPVMAQGTVSQYVAYNDTSTLEMFTFDVIDMFNPIEIPFKFHIDYETFVNMTVYAINVFQSVPVRLFIEIVGQVRNCMIDDFSDVVDQFEEKKFMVSYESVGAGTCLVIHWGDTDLSLVDTWGENITCQGKYPDATYHEDPFLDMIMNISHTFTWRSLFNVSIYAFNDLSFCSHRLMTVVTDIKCKPPIVSIIQGSISHETPLSFVKSKAANIYTLASLDCDLTSTTKKRWQLYRANGTGDLEAYIPTMDVIPSWNKAHLSIPKLHLDYNMYVAWYTITMWDDAIPPGWTFQKRTMTYFEIGQTPLIPILMENAVSKVIRGVTQDLLLQPGTLSIDPDDPDNKNFKVEWRCRKIEEAWPASDTTAKLMSPVAGGGGCFGHGPGLLDYAGTELLIAGDEFVAINQVYEFQATVSKDVRTEAVIGQVHIVDYVAPVLTMRCASPALCKPFGDGVYMNPSSRMAIIAECLEACDGPLDYDWAATDVDGNLFPQNTDYFPLGFDNNEVSFSTQFFDDNPDLTDFHLSLSGVNSFNRKGFASFFMKVNKRPENGYCQVIEPPTRLALVDTYTLVCDEWTDPEDIGVTHYVVNLINELGTRSTVLEMKHFPITPQQEPMVLPPGKLLVEVKVYDEWGAYTVVNVADLEVLMPNEDQVDQAAIEAYIAELQGAGDVQLLNMVLYAQSKVIQEAPWLSLDESLPEDELNARIIKIAEANNVALAAIKENTNYDTLASVNIAAGIMSSILDYSLQTQYTLQTIDTKAREKVLDVSEDAISSIMELDVPEPNDLVQLVTLIAGNNMAMGKNQATFGSKPEEGCFAVPSDFKDKDSFDYNSEVTGLDMVQEADPDVAAKCHITDTTRETAVKMVPDSDKVLHNVSMKMMGGYVVGETHEFQTSNGVYIKMGVVRRKDLIKLDIGITGSSVGLQNAFCPQLNCSMEMPFGFIIREWPVILHSFPKTVDKLSKGTKVIDYELYSRDLEVLVIQDLPPTQTIKVTISKTYGEDGNTTLPAMTKVNAIKASAKKTIPVMYSTFNVTTSDSAISLEILPDNVTNRLFLMIDKPRLPTLKHNMRFYFVKDLTLNDGIYSVFILAKDLAGIGRYFVGVGEFEDNFKISHMANPVKKKVKMNVVKNMTTDFLLRITVNSVAFMNLTTLNWESGGLNVTKATQTLTYLDSSHLTSFGSGMFVMPNTIDFNYVFANMGFSDNLTIYLTLIISLSIFLILLVWARVKDKKDVEKLGAAPLPDNKVEDKYLYEILVFTGNLKGAQSDSIVQFIVSGDDDETDVRTLGDDKRKILRKADVDVFVMAVPRPLGALQFLRVWHDNSGKGPNASWYLSYVVFRDVQTGDKYEFIANKWLAVESDDGQIDRILPVAGKAQKREFQHLFQNTSNKNIADGHLWFSVFLRPPRSRFSRCQRVASCFALLFLSMLVNAMWYDRVPEQPGTGGLKIGPFSLSPEQIGVGVMSNLIVFPPSFLIVFLFRNARPRVLRKSRIEQAVERTRTSKRPGSSSSTRSLINSEQPPDKTPHSPDSADVPDITTKKIIEKKQKKKKFTLPWLFALVAWLLVVGCIAVSCFFLLMYGVMFGNSKATKWITSLVISFFTSILFIEPLKIFLMAILMSAIFKSGNLDEDDADEDEEDPLLEQDEAWLHKGERNKQTLHHNKVDEDILEKLRKARKKEIEMWVILKEIFAYSCFLWVFLIITYGNRDPNAYLLQMNLRHSFLHEGNLDGLDFTKVTNTDRLWYYLFHGLLNPLRAQRTYNDKPPYGLRGFLNDQCNRIMGYATIRQIRIKDKTCRVPSALSYFGRNCSGYTTIFNEESRHYCAGWQLPNKYTANSPMCSIEEFRYSTAAQMQSLPIWGQRDWYSGGGYVIHLKGKTPDIMRKFRQLQRNHWIDEKTRAVIIEFSAYNTQVNLFGMSLIIAEFTPGGGITPNFRFEGIRLLQHHDNFGIFIVACEVVFILFVIYFTVLETFRFYKQRLEYFNNYWSYAEISIIVASYSAMIVYGIRYMATNDVLTTFDRTFGNGYVKLQYAASLDEMYGYIIAFIVFVGTLKFIKLLRFNKRMGVLSATLRQCWDDLSGFLMAFFLCFFSFVALFFLLLNQYMLGFYNFLSAIETSFSMMLGKFQFEEMKQASYVVPFMFFIFVLFNSWVLINLLLTVIIKSFTQVKHDLLKQPNEYEMVAFVWGRFQTFLGMGGPSQVSPVLNTTKKAKEEEAQENKNVQEFPNKVDKFLDYLNTTYFDGTLDMSRKDALKSSMYKNPGTREGSGRFNTRFSE